MIINNWDIRQLPPFEVRFKELTTQVKLIAQKEPERYKTHSLTKLLAAIVRTIKKDIPEDPFHKKFRQGNKLGKEYKHWRRAKNELPPRYRLFFRAHSNDKSVILGWVNDEFTLRKEGDKNDVYNVFRQMLANGTVPNDIHSLIKQSIEFSFQEQKETTP